MQQTLNQIILAQTCGNETSKYLTFCALGLSKVCATDKVETDYTFRHTYQWQLSRDAPKKENSGPKPKIQNAPDRCTNI